MLLRAEAVSKSFGPKEVLKSVEIQIGKGDHLGLIGRNGIGKTTLLKVFMGQIRPDTGEVALRTDRIGYLSQFPVLDPDRTVCDIVGTPYGDITVLALRIAELEEIMNSGSDTDGLDWNDVAVEYARLQEEYNVTSRYGVVSRCRDALKEVGLSEEIAERRVSELSGGEVTKVMLARILVQAHDADILFLDEPTSHLDIETTEWLEEYLMNLDSAIVVVSHDRYFLDRVVTRIMELEHGVLLHYSGNYSTFVKKKTVEMERKLKTYRKNRAERGRLTKIAEEQYSRWSYNSLHKRRMKMVERMEKVDMPIEKKDLNVRIEAVRKSGKDVIMAKGLNVERGGKTILKNINLELEVGDKLGIFGPNGSGKTTFVKALLSEIPYKGDLWVAPGARIGYFAQNHDTLDDNLTAEEQLLLALGKDERLKARNILARFLLTGEEVQSPISILSGGERTRVALALLLAEKRNLLIMDEPTNYLDIPARSAIESALIEYPGTLLIVTHDRYLLDSVCNRVGILRGGSLKVFTGNYSQMKGVRMGDEGVESVHAYRVVTGFKDWTTNKKYKPGGHIVIAESEIEPFRWALKTGKLKEIPGSERKRVRK